MKHKFITVEGNIGSGKTSLSRKLSKDFNSELILESFSENPFLPKFYKDPQKYGLSLELFFMSERYHQLKTKWVDNLFLSTKVSDYFNIDKMEMGTDLNLGQLKSEIMNQPGVLNIVDLKVFNKIGGQYSQSVTSQPYINQTTKQIGLLDDTVFAQANEVLQIRYPNKDIAIRVKKPIKPTFI